MEEFGGIITLIDQDGNECEFELLDRVEYLDAEYVVLLPVEEGLRWVGGGNTARG